MIQGDKDKTSESPPLHVGPSDQIVGDNLIADKSLKQIIHVIA
jgi:hypothetical protein